MIASSLFHFTQEISTLKIILSNKKLRAAYNIEDIQNLYPEEKYAAIPMVCFCDIPLKFITSNHTNRYGFIGIGFKKDWGLKLKINPIMYRIKDSLIEKPFFDLIYETYSNIDRISKILMNQDADQEKYGSVFENILYSTTSVPDNAMKIAAYIKPYEEIRNNYVDREWRWVASGEITFCKENTEKYRKKLNKKYHKNPDFIDFEIDDLNYLIVKKRTDVIKAIRVIKSLKLKELEKDILIQKIIDIESINLDM